MRLGPKGRAQMRMFFAAVLAGLLAASAVQAQEKPEERKQDERQSVQVGDTERTFLLHLPKAYDSQQRYPVVILLHGVNQDGAEMARLTHFNDLADLDSIIAVYPNAMGGRWRFGAGGPRPRPYGPYRRPPWYGPGYPPPPRRPQPPPDGERRRSGQASDIRFLHVLLDRLATNYSIDTRRIYVTGLGDGGFMALRAGCAMADRIAAIAPVAAAMPRTMSCVPARPISAIFINGTDDPILPFDGGEYKGGPFRVLSAEHTAEEWAKLDHCAAKAKESKLPPIQKGGKDTKVYMYDGCEGSAQVALFAVKGSGHTWPSGEQYMVEKEVGKTSNSLNANETIWSFLVTKKILGESGIQPQHDSQQPEKPDQDDDPQRQ